MGSEKKAKPRRVSQSRPTPAPAPAVPTVPPPKTQFEEMLELWRAVPLEAQQHVVGVLHRVARDQARVSVAKQEHPSGIRRPRLVGAQYEPYYEHSSAIVASALAVASDLLAAGMGAVAPKVDDTAVEIVRAPKSIVVGFDFLVGKRITRWSATSTHMCFHTDDGLLDCRLIERGPITPYFLLNNHAVAYFEHKRVLSARIDAEHLAIEAGGALLRFHVRNAHGLSLSEFLHCTWTPNI